MDGGRVRSASERVRIEDRRVLRGVALRLVHSRSLIFNLEVANLSLMALVINLRVFKGRPYVY